MRFSWLGFLALCLVACGTPETAGPEPETTDGSLIVTGREIAERNCAACHSIETSGTSPLAEAPPLRSAIADFDIEALATDFREHIQIGTDIMPDFDFSPLHTDALMAYLLSIEDVDLDE